MERVGAIVVAAGEGRRMQGEDKIFTPLAGKPVLAHTVDVLQKCPSIDQIILVLHPAKLAEGRHMADGHRWSKVTDICPGGRRRQDSVSKGLKRLDGCQWVVIHDGARPGITRNLIERGLKAARHTGAAVPALPVTDTVKVVSGKRFISETPPRQHLWAAQTPQVFRFDIIAEAYRQSRGDVTDDASLVEALGYNVKVYAGSHTNIKVTNRDDLSLAETILKSSKRAKRA